MTAVWLLEILPTVAVKVAVVAPGATVTDPGTLTAALLLDSDTSAPPAAAGCAIVTVHEDVPPALIVVGLHAMLLRLVGNVTAMFPLFPAAATLLPSGAAASTLVTAIVTVPDAALESVAFTTATVPLLIPF